MINNYIDYIYIYKRIMLKYQEWLRIITIIYIYIYMHYLETQIVIKNYIEYTHI